MNNLKKSKIISFKKEEIHQIMELYSKKISIGENSIIGAGSVVYDDVPPNCTIIGNPAKIISRK